LDHSDPTEFAWIFNLRDVLIAEDILFFNFSLLPQNMDGNASLPKRSRFVMAVSRILSDSRLSPLI